MQYKKGNYWKELRTTLTIVSNNFKESEVMNQNGTNFWGRRYNKSLTWDKLQLT